MIRFARDFRLIPIVLLATICLFALKVSGLVFDGGYTFAERMQNHYAPSHEGDAGREAAGLPQDRLCQRQAGAVRAAARPQGVLGAADVQF